MSTLSGPMPNASRVAAMLRSIDGASLTFALGATTNCCSTSGNAVPTRIEETTSMTTATAGICRFWRNAATKNASAQITAMTSRISLAGRTALRSV